MAGLPQPTLSRRALLRAGALGAVTVAAGGIGRELRHGEARADAGEGAPLAQGSYAMNSDWLFGGVYVAGAERPDHPEAGFDAVALPHTVTPLSWGDWDPSTWQRQWIYRRHISSTAVSAGRVFVDFQGVMTTATVWCNGRLLGTHEGGYLPFTVELTEAIVAGDNVLAVRVDATPQNVPPTDVAGGDAAVDYLQPGGIYRDVTLRITPEVYAADVFAKPVDVLTAPGLDVQVTLDCGTGAESVTVSAALLSASTTVAETSSRVAAAPGAGTQVTLSFADLAGISLWSPESPTLYDVRVTVSDGRASHVSTTRTGFREAVFQADGFYLNGSRYEIFGLNRHQLFPYTGMAAPERLQRRDAEILKTELSCNMVRCSHYPQSGYFLDACDELGLMVWQETPGWQYVGDAAFRRLVLQNVEDMIVRDRSRPSVIIWGTRLNESRNHESLYAQTGEIAAALDGTRQTTGAMATHSLTGWNQQVYGYDDYHSVDGAHEDATLLPPLPGVPYMVSEAVGALDGAPRYRWIDPEATLALQGRMHAQVHSIAQGDPGYAGLLGWCGFDFQSLHGGDRIWRAMKTPGVHDTFRVPKPAAGFYSSQTAGDPVIAPAFSWDFGPASPPDGPGAGAIVFTNCEQLDVYAGDASAPTLTGLPDTAAFPDLAHAPVVVDFPSLSAAGSPALRIDGLIGGRVVTSLQMSADATQDALALTVDDAAILADGSDATRYTLRIVDRYGNRRPLDGGSDLQATFALSGPGTLVGDNPFAIGAYGGVAGGFIRSVAGRTGTVTLTASCPGYAPRSVDVDTVAGTPLPAPLGGGGARVLTAPASPALPPTRALARRAGRGPEPTESPSSPEASARAALRRLLSSSHSHRAIMRGEAELAFSAPSSGTLVVGWYHESVVLESGRQRIRRVLVASVHAHVRRRGRAHVHLRLTDRGRALLRHPGVRHLHAEAHFRARGRQHAVTESREITLRR